MRTRTCQTRGTILSLFATALLLISFTGTGFGQALPDAGLQLLTLIPIPNWATAGANAAAYDTNSFNPATRTWYVADAVNGGITAIDAKTLSYVGTVKMPGCCVAPTTRSSGSQVAPDLQKLIGTDRNTGIFIWDLRVPGQGPVASFTGHPGVDEMDYDPINQRAYIGTAAGPGQTLPPGTVFGIDVIDVANNRYLGFIPMVAEVDKVRFNPVDGLLYVDIPAPDVNTPGLTVVVDPAQGTVGTAVANIPLPNGCSNGIDIDPVTDTAMLMCSGRARHAVIDLHSGAVVQNLPLSGADVGEFNPHTRRWYVESGNANLPTGVTVNCPGDNAGNFPALAVVSATPSSNQTVGVACTGRGHAVNGVDAVDNLIFVPVVQYPPSTASAATGTPGVLVFRDPAPTASAVGTAGAVAADVRAVLSPVGGSGVIGTVDVTLRRRNMSLDGGFTGVTAGATVRVITETTVGHESIPCGVSATGQAYCDGYLVGDPLVGAPMYVSSNGQRVAAGTMTLVSSFPSFIPIE